MLDNFKLIKPLLNFDSEDDYYHLQIIKRKKENKELGSNSYIVKTYYIKSIEELEKDKGEMICLANYHNARVCINLNRRSFEKVAFQTLRKITDIIMNKDYKSVRKAYNSVCGVHSNEPIKRWIIDIDTHDIPKGIEDYINNIAPIGNKIVAKIPTKNGWHLITNPFNLSEFANFSRNLDLAIHKDNPSILFIP